jgi:glycosyltransferase involved in cell wall biosynthesis
MGLEALLGAVARLRTSHEVRLAVVGGGSLERALRDRAEALGIAAAVQFEGRVSDVVLADWYRAADAFVLPTTAYEGFGMVTLEALASGTPVIGTPVGATPELLRPLEPRLLARGTAESELATAIEEALPIIGPELRERARAYAVSRFAWGRVIGAWEAQLAAAAGTVLDGNPGSRIPGPTTGAETPRLH